MVSEEADSALMRALRVGRRRRDARSQCARQGALVLGEFAVLSESGHVTCAVGRPAAARVRQARLCVWQATKYMPW